MLKIVYQDDQILVVNKPAGLVVNRSQTAKSPTLQDLLSDYLKLPRGDLGIGERAGIVHRLDRQTSGLIVIAKTDHAFNFLQDQFKRRKVKKEYLALVHGWLKDKIGEISLPLGRHPVARTKFAIVASGREAKTGYKVVKEFEFREKLIEKFFADLPKRQLAYFKAHGTKYSLLEVQPATGRTHQIRVHAKSSGHPVVSDPLYLPRKLKKFDEKFCPRLFLHAKNLTFTHPKTGKPVTFEAPLPNDLQDALEYLKEITNAN